MTVRETEEKRVKGEEQRRRLCAKECNAETETRGRERRECERKANK